MLGPSSPEVGVPKARSALSQARAELPGVANSRATNWNRPPIDRMANLNIEPGDSTVDELIASIERAGGTFQMDSRVGNGTRCSFELSFSVNDPNVTEEELATGVPKSVPGKERSRRVLVVDDEPTVREVVVGYLRRDGHDLRLAQLEDVHPERGAVERLERAPRVTPRALWCCMVAQVAKAPPV